MRENLLFNIIDSNIFPKRADLQDAKDILAELEQKFLIAGTDEAGRGALAGPVCAAAAYLTHEQEQELLALGLKDSKKLTQKSREKIFAAMQELGVLFAYSFVNIEVIERENILNASLSAMRRSVFKLLNKLNNKDICVIVDGNIRIKDLNLTQWPLIKADLLIPAVSAASVIAKVTRDNLMLRLDEIYKYYNFAKNKGYPVKEHIEAIRLHGLSPVHRKSFCRKIIKEAG